VASHVYQGKLWMHLKNENACIDTPSLLPHNFPF